MDKLAEKLAATHSLKNAFDPILNVILSALDAPPVFMRTKALKALSQVLTIDSTILTNVRDSLYYPFSSHFHNLCRKSCVTPLKAIYWIVRLLYATQQWN